jgi:hypothetical protein
MQNTMQIFYETVLYGAGVVNKNDIPGFATIHYDLEPSPLSVLGGGTTSIFGPGGIVDGIGSVIGDIQSGNFGVGTILKGINTYNNAKKIKAKDAVKEELKGIVKEGVLDIGKSAGTITNPVGNFSIGNAAVTAINNNVGQYTTILSPTESVNLVTTNTVARDRVASALYYQQVGSRNGQTIAQSDVAYAALTDNEKSVYRDRTTAQIASLVADGYIKINRNTQNVSITAEKANI